MTTKVPPAPKGSGPAGRRLWSAITRAYELEEHELALLRRAVAVADRCAALQEVADDEGPMIRDRHGDVRTHPALVELRQCEILLARLVVALRVPLGDDEAPARPQRRGVRGVYGGKASR